MKNETFRILQSVLGKDSTDTTYKYALLRAMIEISDEYDHQLISISDKEVVFPFGLIIEKWLFYYYPIIEAGLPQRNGANPNDPKSQKIVFRSELENLIERYKEKGGYHAFVRDYRSARMIGSDELFVNLIKKLKRTIADYPMKHLGYSHYKKHYQIVFPHKDWNRLTHRLLKSSIDSEFLIRNMGQYSIDRNFYDIFQLIGGFINGTDAVVYQWAKFSAKAVDGLGVTVNQALQSILASPDVDRNVTHARRFFLEVANTNSLNCIWSGKEVHKENLAIDHVIPFSLWGNNDLWNLLPTDSLINGKKGDKIPDPEFVYQCRESISESWLNLNEQFADSFGREMRVSLVGVKEQDSNDGWVDTGLDALINKCEYLIDVKGFQSWSL